MKNTYLLRYAGGILLFALGALASHFGVTVLSFVLFLVLAAGETVLCYREQRRILDFRILLSLSWLLAIGLSRLDLSLHQTPFSLNTWLACGLFYFGFLAAYDLFVFLNGRRQEGGGQEAAAEPASGDGAVVPVQMPERYLKRLKLAIFIVAGLGLAGFLAECVVFRFEIPILVRGISHSYSEFHISGVHYFVVSLWMVHALTVIYMLRKKCDESETMGLLILNLACFAVPVMLLSKFQILIHALLPGIIYLLLRGPANRKKMVILGSIAAVLLAGMFVLIIFARHYPETYLAWVFQFRKPETPVGIQYVYMYIVNNLENLNLLVNNISRFTFGARQLFPFIALTGIKFLMLKNGIPPFFQYELFMTVPELTTLSILYDVYGDFGVPGCLLFGLLLGLAGAWITERAKRGTVAGLLLYSQLAVYVALSFFTTWFSNPATWFFLAATGAIAVFLRIGNGKKGDSYGS